MTLDVSERINPDVNWPEIGPYTKPYVALRSRAKSVVAVVVRNKGQLPVLGSGLFGLRDLIILASLDCEHFFMTSQAKPAGLPAIFQRE